MIEDAQSKETEPDAPGYSIVVVDAAIAEAAKRYVRGGYAAVQRAADLFHEGSEGDALLDLGGPKARTFVDIALLGQKPLLPFIEPWQVVRVTEVEDKTAAMDKTAVERFVEAFPLAHTVTKPAVANWIEKRKVDVSAQTVQREVTGLRSFWRYLRTRHEVPEDFDPFAGQRFKDRQKDRNRTKRVDFSPAEVSALYAAALKSDDKQLADLIAMAAYTGARREELCALKVADVSRGWIKIQDAKTEAGNREVPIHAALVPTLHRLIGKRTAGYVIGETREDKWGNRGDALGKRFTLLKASMGFGRDKTFHSIRHSFSTQLRSKGVPEHVVADLMGHKLKNITFANYAGAGSAKKLLPRELAKLRYPRPL
jgi:integrase